MDCLSPGSSSGDFSKIEICRLKMFIFTAINKTNVLHGHVSIMFAENFTTHKDTNTIYNKIKTLEKTGNQRGLVQRIKTVRAHPFKQNIKIQ